MAGKIILRRGLHEQIKPGVMNFGEICFMTDKKKLVTADIDGSVLELAEVVEGPHDQNLYFKSKIDGRYYSLGVRPITGNKA